MASPSSPAPAVACFRACAGAVEVDVLVQPRASRSGVVGLHDGRLKVQLAAPPVDGAANDALVELLADRLRLPARQVQLVRGETSRRKTVRLEGAHSVEVVRTRLLSEIA